MTAAAGRLRSRSRAGSDPLEPPWPPGLRPLPGGLVLVPEPPRPDRLVVYFHGAGGTAASGLALWQAAATAHGLLVLLPQSSGRTWDLILRGLGPDVATTDAGMAEIFTRFRPSRVALAGFSDGATYALALGLANGDLVDGVLAFSPGYLAPPQRVGRPPVWLSHGRGDTVLPIDRCGRRVVAQLRRANYDVTYDEFDGGHVVTPSLLDSALASWLAG